MAQASRLRVLAPSRRQKGMNNRVRCVFRVLAGLVAQTSSLSVSPGIVAGRANSPERGCVRSTSRSASKPPGVPVLLQSFGSLLPAATGPADRAALLWLRLCRLCHAELYRRFLTCYSPPASNVLPIANRRLARSVLWTFVALRRAKPFRRFRSGSSRQIKNVRYAKHVAADVRRLCSIGFLQSEPPYVGCYNSAFS